MSNPKLLYAILALASLAIFGGLGYLASKSQTKESTTVITTPLASSPSIQHPTNSTADSSAEDSSTADWQTYENKKFRFSFKYPKDFILESKQPGLVLLKKTDERSDLETLPPRNYFQIGALGGHGLVGVVDEKYKETSLTQNDIKWDVSYWKKNDNSYQFIGAMTQMLDREYVVEAYAEKKNASEYSILFDRIIATFKLTE